MTAVDLPSAFDTTPSRRSRNLAVLCSLWCWLGPLALAAIVVRLTSARSDLFLKRVTAEVLNLQIAAIVPTAACIAAFLAGANALGLVALVLYVVIIGYGYVIGIVGAVKAERGIAWSYPINLRLVAAD